MERTPPPAPGIYPNVAQDEYRAWDAVSATELKTMHLHSPAHARVERDVTEEMELGTAAHLLVLEPEEFAARYAIMPGPEVDLRTKAGKTAWQDFQAANPGKDCLRPTDGERVAGMRSSVWHNPHAKQLLLDATHTEASIVWTDPATGLACKCRPDVIAGSLAIVDLKTTRDASPERFGDQAWRLAYHVQLAFYMRGVRTLGDVEYAAVIAVESAAPWACAVYEMSKRLLAEGDELVNGLLTVYRECKQLDHWPSYSSRVETLDVPAWAMRRLMWESVN